MKIELNMDVECPHCGNVFNTKLLEDYPSKIISGEDFVHAEFSDNVYCGKCSKHLTLEIEFDIGGELKIY